MKFYKDSEQLIAITVEMISIEVDGITVEVPEGSSVKEALEALGFQIIMFPSDPGIFMPCQTGGCWSCAVDIDGELRPACVSKVQQGMRIKTDASSLTPRRIGADLWDIMWEA